MMTSFPTISIVVPSFNQAQYLPETLQSIIDQDYPAMEVIIQDGGSDDGSIPIAEDYVRRYPDIIKLYVEKDNGQADALNRGFKRATGDIMAFLNSDDTYFPAILHRVAKEIEPSLGRSVIMGRCLFTGENSHYVGIEHPAEYKSHFDLLAIWKRGFNTIPQPSVFWHRTVWDRCGGLDVHEDHALDYDLFCRFSRYYAFHRVDELFSTYRMHDSSKSSQRSEAEVLDLSIHVSRKHWGAWVSPLRWRCEFSYWLHNRQRHERARHHARKAEKAFAEKRYGSAAVEFTATLIASPLMAQKRLFNGWLMAKGIRLFQRWVVLNEGFTQQYEDGWIGPIYREQRTVSRDDKKLIIKASHSPQPSHKKIKVQLFINGKVCCSKRLSAGADFSLFADVEAFRNQTILIELRTNSSFVPSILFGGEDKRRLSLRLSGMTIDGRTKTHE